jgi:hypothetical protein
MDRSSRAAMGCTRHGVELFVRVLDAAVSVHASCLMQAKGSTQQPSLKLISLT